MSIKILSPELAKKCEEELYEVPERIEEDFKHIRKWLIKQPHLNIRPEDGWLLNFLRGCKFSLLRTKQKLDMFYTMRTVLQEFFVSRDPLLVEMQRILELGIFVPLPKTTYPGGPRVILIRWEIAEIKQIPFTTAMKIFLMITDILMNEDDNFIVSGAVIILDLNGLTMNNALKVTPSLCKKIVMLFQDTYPIRLQGFYFINTPPFFNNIFNFTKPLINKKALKRIYFYNEKSVNEVNEFILPDILPKEYGGTSLSLEELSYEWKRKVESYRQWFLEDSQYCSDEDKRPLEPTTCECLFGVDGSYRKLEFV